MHFTEEQTSILNESSNSFRVLAAAGSGKTSTMAKYVQQEVSAGRLSASQVCFITFTRFAADQIRRRVAQYAGASPLKIMCGTFHSVMYRFMMAADHIDANHRGTKLYDARMEEGVKHFLALLKGGDPALVQILRNFRILIVDEFQDLDETQFLFVKLFKRIQPELRVIAIGDLAQNIYRFRGTSNEFLRTCLQRDVDSQLRTYRLTTNFRSSPTILKLVNTVFDVEIANGHILPMNAPVEKEDVGIRPKYYEYTSAERAPIGAYEERVVETLFPILKDAKRREKSVVIIFPIIKCMSCQLIVSLLRQKSNHDGFPFDIHQIAKEDETTATVEFKYNPRENDAPVQFSTFHSSKGLEWDIVALVNVSDDMNMPRDSEDDCEGFYAEKTNLFYVGITRAIEEVYIFANKLNGGRHRHLVRMGSNLTKVFDCTFWGGEGEPTQFSPALKPIGVKDLIRKLPQYDDLYERIIQVTENIKYSMRDGCQYEMSVYEEMKMRNREMAFGTFMDWKLKQRVCSKQPKTLQDSIYELASCYGFNSWFTKSEAMETVDMRIAKLMVYFLNAHMEPVGDLAQYVIPSRYLALYRRKLMGMTTTFKTLYDDIQQVILKISAKDVKTVRDEYILSHVREFYSKGSTSEIQAALAPARMYQGLPHGFEEFAETCVNRGEEIVLECFQEILPDLEEIEILGDLALESQSLILGEGDMATREGEGAIVEIKCGTAQRATELRDVGDCKNMLQVLAYAALGRHGTIPFECRWAVLLNPMTGTREIYDLSTWSREESGEFMRCLEELRVRTAGTA